MSAALKDLIADDIPEEMRENISIINKNFKEASASLAEDYDPEGMLSEDALNLITIKAIKKSLIDSGREELARVWEASLIKVRPGIAPKDFDEPLPWDTSIGDAGSTRELSKAIDRTVERLVVVYNDAIQTPLGNDPFSKAYVSDVVKKAIVGTIDALELSGDIRLRWTHNAVERMSPMEGLGESFMSHFDEVNT